METFHKLAGVQDASDLQTSSNERPSLPQVIPEPPPIPESDTEAQYNGSNGGVSPRLSHRGSRASLPLNRQPSHKSFRSSKHHRSRSQSRENRSSTGTALADALAGYPPVPPTKDLPQHNGTSQQQRSSQDTGRSVGTTNTTSDFAWGPSHPCYPHPNPHCLPTSPEYHSTRVIRVRRDWLASGDLYPQYANLYPEILDPLVSDTEFRTLISNINARLKAAFDPFSTRAWVDAVMGAVTGFVWEDLGLTGRKRGERGLEAVLERWNAEREREGKEVRVVGLRGTGFMSLDFVVPDPGIDGVGGEGAEEVQEGEGGIGPAE